MKAWVRLAAFASLGAVLHSTIAQEAPPARYPPIVKQAKPDESQQSMFRSSKIIGTTVRDLQRRKIGEIHDLILGSRRGEIAYAVISFGGVMGVGKTFHAVPWQALEPRESGRYYALNADRATIRGAPSFDKARWPDMDDPRWSAEVDGYWERMVGRAMNAENELQSVPSGASISKGSEAAGPDRPR